MMVYLKWAGRGFYVPQEWPEGTVYLLWTGAGYPPAEAEYFSDLAEVEDFYEDIVIERVG